jgi:hypothetical protein
MYAPGAGTQLPPGVVAPSLFTMLAVQQPAPPAALGSEAQKSFGTKVAEGVQKSAIIFVGGVAIWAGVATLQLREKVTAIAKEVVSTDVTKNTEFRESIVARPSPKSRRRCGRRPF